MTTMPNNPQNEAAASPNGDGSGAAEYPTVSRTTERIYNERIPEVYRTEDERRAAGDKGYPMLRYLSAMGDIMGGIEHLIERIDYTPLHEGGVLGDTSDLTNPITANSNWLDWLGQLLGVKMPAGADAALKRDAAMSAATGWKAGSRQAIIDAVRPVLTGTQHVEISSHYAGDPWAISIKTRASETPSNDVVIQAIYRKGVKPAGYVVLNIAFSAEWNALEDLRETWNLWEDETWTEIEETGLAADDDDNIPDPGTPADLGPPTVTAHTPTAGATNVAQQVLTGDVYKTTVTIQFSEPIASATITTGTVLFRRKSDNANITATRTLSPTGDQLTIESTATRPGIEYEVTLKGGLGNITDVGGNEMVADKVFAFTTASDTTKPTIVGAVLTYAQKDTTGVDKGTDDYEDFIAHTLVAGAGTAIVQYTNGGAPTGLHIAFDKPMAAASFTDTTIFVRRVSDGVTVDGGAGSYAAGPYLAPMPRDYIQPQAHLTVGQEGVDVELVIKGGATGPTDTVGNRLAADVVYRFNISEAAATTEPPAPPPPTPTSPDASRWEFVERDDFNRTTLQDGGRWGVGYESASTWNAGLWKKSQLGIRNGIFEITGVRTGVTPAGVGSDMLAGGVNHHLYQLYGAWEMRIKMDKGMGYGGVALLWPVSGRWPQDGEIDIFETPFASRDRMSQFVHYTSDDAPNTDKQTGFTVAGMDFSQYHVLRVEWLPWAVRFYVDGILKNQVTDPAKIESGSRMGLVFQVDFWKAGMGWIQGPPDATTPAECKLSVDWINIEKPSKTLDVAIGMRRRFVGADGRVYRPDQGNDIVSEGIAYGMMMDVWADNPTGFLQTNQFARDKLERRLPHISAMIEDPGYRTRGLHCMAWWANNDTNASIRDPNFATDADLDRIFALICAYRKWFLGRGDTRFSGALNEALVIAGELRVAAFNLSPDGTKAYLAADSYGQNNVLGVPRDNGGAYPGGVFEMNVSYITLYVFRLLQTYDTANSAFWAKAISGSYDVLTKVADNIGSLATTSGLFPDWNSWRLDVGEPDEITPGRHGWTYQRSIAHAWDAFRTIPRLYWDWVWFGDERSRLLLTRLLPFFKQEWQARGDIYAEYFHDGSVKAGYSKPFFTVNAWYVAKAAGDTAFAAQVANKLKKEDLYRSDPNGSYWVDGPAYYGTYWTEYGVVTMDGSWVIP